MPCASRWPPCRFPAGQDVKLSESRIEGYRNFSTKLWNAARFAEMNEARLDPDFDPAGVRSPINRWIVSAVTQLGKELEGQFEGYRFNDAANSLYHFIWGSFCDWYLEFTKPLLTGEDEALKAETRATAAWTLARILHFLHPIMPYVTEELWENLTGEGDGALITSAWPAFDQGLIDEVATAEVEWVIALISEVRSVRSETSVPVAARVDLLMRDADDKTKARIAAHGDIIRRLARIETLEPGCRAKYLRDHSR